MRRVHLESRVGLDTIVVANMFLQDARQTGLVHVHNIVGAFAPDRTDEPVATTMLPR